MKRTLSVAAALALAASLLGAAPTSDDPDPQGPPCCKNGTVTRVENVRKYRKVVDYSQELARCHWRTKGGTCSISQTTSADTTVQVGGGLTVKMVSVQLGISSTKSVSISVQCDSPPLRRGQYLVAFPIGTRYVYSITKQDAMGLFPKQTVKKNARAFRPDRNAFSCGVRG
jgi:hypothetical protein